MSLVRRGNGYRRRGPEPEVQFVIRRNPVLWNLHETVRGVAYNEIGITVFNRWQIISVGKVDFDIL